MNILRTGLLAAVLASGFGAASAQAAIVAPLSLTAQAPDVNLPFVSTTYAVSGSTSTFTSSTSGDVGSLNFGASSIANAFMNLTVTFTKSGSTFLPTSGSIDVGSIAGAITTDYFKSSIIKQFSTTTNASGSQAFEFLFGGNTGTLGTTKDIGIILHTAVSSAPDANFDVSFNNNAGIAGAQSDTFAVPEPASLSILAVAAPLFMRRRRSMK